MRLKGKVAAITGSGQGIGRAAAELFAHEGAKVVILEINPETGKEAEKAITEAGGTAHFIQVDLSDAKQVEKAFAEIEEKFGGLHVLYNNASVYLKGKDAPVTEVDIETWHKVIACNLDGLFYCCKFGIDLIKKSGGGSVINTSSSAGLIGIPRCDAYTATKGATIALTRSMAVRYGPEGVRVNCIAPAGVKTPMLEKSSQMRKDFNEQDFLDRAPLRRWGKVEDLANLALFLASDESAYINGVIIPADGAITIRPFYGP